MLTEIRCGILDKEFHKIQFRQGLNIVLGDSNGSNALGKTIFLQLIEFCFGGDVYMAMGSDIRNHIEDHAIYFTFSFSGEEFYFYRETSNLNCVCRCDKQGNLIEEMPLRRYRHLLSDLYHLSENDVDIADCLDHFSRMYGKDNVQERYPFQAHRKEKDDEAIDFLQRLFGGADILKSIHKMESVLGVKASEFKKIEQKIITDEQIQTVENEINALKERQSKLMQGEDDERLVLLGLNTESVVKASNLQRELRLLVKKRNEYESKKNAILSGNEKFCKEVVEQDIEDLKFFFPEINMKALDDIQHFHVKIREILADEARDEANNLQQYIDQCDKEITDFQRRIDETGYTKEITTRILSQGISISREIEKKQEELERLKREKEQQEGIKDAERKMADLIEQEWRLIRQMQKEVNKSMSEYNTVVAENSENPPSMGIGNDKTVNFGTYGNTSESTAFKALVLYDLSILKNTKLPILIHDSNIIRRINRTNLEKLFQLYEVSQKQVFIVFDNTNNISDRTKEIIDFAKVISLTEEHRLYGKSWANMKKTER